MNGSFSLWLFVISAAASALGGMLGVASGIFIVPILTISGHVEIHTAIGASIVSVIACSCGGAALDPIPASKVQADPHRNCRT
jgi:uncharacterized membrane protein YfcA